MNRDFDVIVYGTVCMDLVWRVDRLAPPGSYEAIRDERRMIGGEATNSAIALSRWGLRVALVGTATGDDQRGKDLREMLATDAPDVDIAGISTRSGAATAYCVCIATPDGHRTMYGSGFDTMQCPVLEPTLAARAAVFTMDPNAYDAGVAACRVATASGAKVVAMDYTRSAEVNQIAAVSITSHEAVAVPLSMAACADYAALVRNRNGCTTVVTCGEEGCFVAERGAKGLPAVHVPAYRIERVVDSTGAGDVFRAGVIYGLIQGWDTMRTVSFASAAAALNCTEMGGWGGVRSLDAIEQFQRGAQAAPTGR